MVPTQKSSKIFLCECCHYSTSRKSQYERHLSTDKHKILQNPTSKKFQNEINKYICNCGKIYSHSSTLYAHKKKCISNEIINEDATKEDKYATDKDLIMLLIKENGDLKNMIMEVIKNGTNNNNINTTHTNSHNKAFNLNFFLNETCKNAMNIMDFVDSIQLQLSDLEKVGEIGYVEGISNIIVKNLKKLDVTERPVHCTDSKRETLYIKDENKWEKENENKNKIKKAVKRVANKNISLLPEFKSKYPDCIYSDSKKSDQYNKIIIEAFELNNDDKQERVIKKIAKEVTIDKETNSFL